MSEDDKIALLALALDGNVDAETQVKIERLIESDPDFRSQLEELKEAQSSLASSANSFVQRLPLPSDLGAKTVLNVTGGAADEQRLSLLAQGLSYLSEEASDSQLESRKKNDPAFAQELTDLSRIQSSVLQVTNKYVSSSEFQLEPERLQSLKAIVRLRDPHHAGDLARLAAAIAPEGTGSPVPIEGNLTSGSILGDASVFRGAQTELSQAVDVYFTSPAFLLDETRHTEILRVAGLTASLKQEAFVSWLADIFDGPKARETIQRQVDRPAQWRAAFDELSLANASLADAARLYLANNEFQLGEQRLESVRRKAQGGLVRSLKRFLFSPRGFGVITSLATVCVVIGFSLRVATESSKSLGSAGSPELGEQMISPLEPIVASALNERSLSSSPPLTSDEPAPLRLSLEPINRGGAETPHSSASPTPPQPQRPSGVVSRSDPGPSGVVRQFPTPVPLIKGERSSSSRERSPKPGAAAARNSITTPPQSKGRAFSSEGVISKDRAEKTDSGLKQELSQAPGAAFPIDGSTKSISKDGLGGGTESSPSLSLLSQKINAVDFSTVGGVPKLVVINSRNEIEYYSVGATLRVAYQGRTYGLRLVSINTDRFVVALNGQAFTRPIRRGK